MARLSAEVRLFTLTMSEPAAIVERLNRDFCHRAIGDRFITFLLVLVDADAAPDHRRQRRPCRPPDPPQRR